MRGMWKLRILVAGAVLSIAAIADAQPIGTFVWQLAPYCNRVVITVMQVGSIFTLDGYDDQCGAVRKGSVVGTALVNATEVQLLMTTVTAPGGAPVHVDARISLSGFSGTWFDSAAASGPFVFNGPGGGPERPVGARSGPLEINATLSALPELRVNGATGDNPDIIGYKTGGSLDAPSPTPSSQVLFTVGGGGFGGTQFTGTTAGMHVVSRETFTDTAHGSALVFTSTATGTSTAPTRMTIEHTGNVGIGGGSLPVDKLQVAGDIRVGTGGTNGCVKRIDGNALIGSCSSDARFKRDITPFASSLDAVATLRPVHFYWRAAEFPQKHFGSEQGYGLIAQDLEQVLPELVTIDDDGYKAVDYAKLPLLAIQAIKELKEKNDALDRRLRALEERATVPR